MSTNYADGLSPYPNKGQLGLQEKFDNASTIATKVDMLAKWINKSKHVVLHTGAGISTAAGIPDFRGPRGVWTLEAKGQKPDLSKDFNEAIPTATHMAVARLVESGKVKYVISQNIDGLHLRSGLARKYLSELHGNMFIEQCNSCNRQFVRNKAVPTVGQKSLNKACPTIKSNGRPCRGRLHDCILDWEHSLPENDLAMADFHSCMADLSIAIGTTMQIVPSGSLPLYTKRAGGKLVIINLQPTKHDKKADLQIHGYADEVMAKLMKQLSLRIPKYAPTNDPTKLSLSSDRYFDWTITDSTTAQMQKQYEAKCGTDAKKRLEVIDEDDVPLVSRIEKTTRKRKSDEGGSGKKAKRDNDDSDLEVVDEIPRPRRGRPKKVPDVQSPPKLTIKKTPGQTKYEIVKEKKQKREVEIVRQSVGELCGDLEMVCESDDDDGPMVFTTNFKRYLYDDKTFAREPKPEKDEKQDTEINDQENKDKKQDTEMKDQENKDEKPDTEMKDQENKDGPPESTPTNEESKGEEAHSPKTNMEIGVDAAKDGDKPNSEVKESKENVVTTEESDSGAQEEKEEENSNPKDSATAEDKEESQLTATVDNAEDAPVDAEEEESHDNVEGDAIVVNENNSAPESTNEAGIAQENVSFDISCADVEMKEITETPNEDKNAPAAVNVGDAISNEVLNDLEENSASGALDFPLSSEASSTDSKAVDDLPEPTEESVNPEIANDGNNNRANSAIEGDAEAGGEAVPVADGQQAPRIQQQEETLEQENISDSTGICPISDIDLLNAALPD